MLRTRSPRKEKISNCYLHSNSLSNKMDNSLLAVRDINHKYIVVDESANCAYLQELVQEIAEDKGFTVHLFECGEGDHVHCFVSAPPKLSITAIVKYLKGISGRKLFERFPEIRNQLWKGELWNHSYYVEMVGSVSEENIRRYIEHQSKAY